jgi:hypothetical protein
MENSYLQSRHPVFQLLMLVLITVICVLAFTLVALIAGIMIFRIPLNDWLGVLSLDDPSTLPALKFVQITQSLSMFVHRFRCSYCHR